jgi:hypothetical protein
VGKIFVSIAHILLLITASLPLMAMVFLFGGIKFTDILLLFAFYIATAIMVGSVGTFYSTIFKKTIVSIVMTYLTLFVLVVGTVIIFAVWGVMVMRLSGTPSYGQFVAFFFANPFFGFGSVIEGTAGDNSLFNGFVQMATAGNSDNIFIKSSIINMGFDFILTAVLVFISAWKIKPIK